jgi:N-sulfoglucosamine sulfohydrolase
MRRWLLVILLVLFPTLVQAAPAKNIVLMIADDLGLDLGCYGNPAVRTPNLDALAARGTRFPLAFASVASCSPSRASLYTGQPTHMNGMYGLAHATHNFASYAKTKSVPGLLPGYRSAVIGKLHVQPKEVFPFEELKGPIAGGRNGVAMAEVAREFITEQAGKPFFLVMGYTDPHRDFMPGKTFPGLDVPTFDPKTVKLPYHLPDTPTARQDLADYYSAVNRLDTGVGKLLTVLKDTKVDDSTLVIFVSDNGIPFPGAKTTVYDAGIHLPMIVAKPGQQPTVCAGLASWTDVAPTILDWAGVKPLANLPGRSLLPILEQANPTGWETVFASHQFHEVTMYYPMRAVRTRTHKLILNLAHQLPVPSASDLYGSPTWQSILKTKGDLGQRTFAQFTQRPAVELYDLTTDPHELKNRADDASVAPVLAELKTKLAAWRKQTNDPWLIKDTHE